MSCDGEPKVSLTAATQPSIEEIALGALPGLPKIALHWPLIDFECGPEQGADKLVEWFHKAGRGELEPFVLAVGTCATYGGIHAMAGNPTGAMGVPGLPGLGLEVQGRGPDRLCAWLPRKKGPELVTGYTPDWGDDRVRSTRLRARRRLLAVRHRRSALRWRGLCG